jgi:hypothetical protein
MAIEEGPMRASAGDIYESIFADAVRRRAEAEAAGEEGCSQAKGEARAELRRAIARAVRELRTAMEKDGNPAVTMAHARNLDDIDPAALAGAYALAERNCIFWPGPGEIRELAGCSEHQEAQEALDWVFGYLEAHGISGRRQSGAVTITVDNTGRRNLAVAAPAREAPAIPPRIQRALGALGNGSVKHGLLYVSQHPRLKGWEEPGGDPAGRAERIERQWTRCYRQALR